MTRVAVYAIMLDEERNIPAWWDSVSEADVVYVVDTGSSDSTVEMLHHRGARVRVSPWRGPVDMAAARNKALDMMVGDDVDLCVWLDADERFTPGWRAEVDEDPEHLAMSVLLDSGGGQAWRTHPRTAVHDPSTHRWSFPVHERLDGPPPTRRLGTRVLMDTRHRRHHTWIPELREAVRNYPWSARMHFYLGRDLLLMGRYEEAERMLRRSITLNDVDRTLHGEAMRLLYGLTDDETWLHSALKSQPGRRETWVDMCMRASKVGDREDARACWREAADCEDEWLWTTFHYAWDEPFQRLGQEVGAL